jgi:AcrR family transcriptional regulator
MADTASPGMRQRFIDTVLDMLQEGFLLRELNLRQIAKRIGCAHTNAYNYFNSYEQLIWYAQAEAIIRLVKLFGGSYDELHRKFVLVEDKNILESFIKFAFTHPAWYRLIWTEPLQESRPQELTYLVTAPSQLMRAWLERETDKPAEDHEKNSEILLSFLHGQLSLITSGRKKGSTRELVEQLFESTNYVYSLLY